MHGCAAQLTVDEA
jgi:hypothetical protein